MGDKIVVPQLPVRVRNRYCYLKRLAPTHEKLTLPTQAKIGENIQEGIIVSVGDQISDLKAGNHVHYMKTAGNTFSVGGHEIVCINADAVVAVIETPA